MPKSENFKLKKEMFRLVCMVIIFVDIASAVSTCDKTVNIDSSVTTIDLNDTTKPNICSWNLHSPNDTTIVVKIIDIQLRGGLDRVIALDGPDENKTVIQQCGLYCNLKGAFLISSKNKMLLQTYLDGNNDIRIVSVEAWAQDNGGRFYDKGYITLKNSTDNSSYYQLHSTIKDSDEKLQIQLILNDSLMYPKSSVKVYDGISDQGPLLANFRTIEQFVPITSSQQDLLIVTEGFNDEALYFGGSFDSVKPDCHKVSSESSGTFSLDRKNLMTGCNWLINPTVSSGNIILDLSSVDLCGNETLVIYEGLSSFGQKLGTITKKTQLTSYPLLSAPAGNGLSIFLDRPALNTTCITPPFSGSYWTVPACTSDLQPTGTITSPLYPSQYPLNYVCQWNAKPVDKATSLYVTFNTLDLSGATTINLNVKSKQVANYTGSALPASDLVTKVTSNTTASIVFDSNTGNLGTGIEIPGQGFSLSYKILECGNQINAGNGTLSSDTDIPDNVTECIWVITVPLTAASQFKNIVSLKLIIAGGGKGYKIELRDGGSVRSPLLYSGLKSMSTVTTNNMVWVRFARNSTENDEAAANTSFNLYFDTFTKPLCNKVSRLPYDEYILHRKNFSAKCTWAISPDQTSGNIIFEIRSTDLCDNETLYVYEGGPLTGRKLGTVTKTTQSTRYPKFSASVKKGLSMYMKKDGSSSCNSTVVVQGSYWTVPDCSADLVSTSTIKNLTSPLYPDQYPLNSHCTWTTKPLPGNKTASVYVTINKVDLRDGNNVKVINKGKPLSYYTGSELLPDTVAMVTENVTASIVFDSSIMNNGTGLETPGYGFSLSYRFLECGASLNAKNGTLSSLTDIPTNASECIWVITVPPTTGKTGVNIVSFNVDIKGVAKWQNLELRDGGRATSPLLNHDLSMTKSLSFLTRYNVLWIHYRRNTTGDIIMSDTKFSFKLSFKTFSCGSKHQCRNGICLHPDWKCNGLDDCGDNTDEADCIVSSNDKGVKAWLTAVLCIICFLIGVVLTIVLPALYKRWKYPNYNQLKDIMDPSIS
ncbi:cubilin-like isoform X1 [Mytilus edulis]|uniref:cubilin-like isoform X1 n=2 Tax=Mytilus edulis TaxID=6550 RepID=UPI0039EF2BD7